MRIAAVVLVAIASTGITWADRGLDRSDWLPQYPALVRWLSTLPDKSWRGSIGSDGKTLEDRMAFTLNVESRGSILLTSRYKQQAIDGQSGEPIPGMTIDIVMTIRDKNGDGVPDEFRPEPFHPDLDETITPGGFIVVRQTVHGAIILQWDTMIGVAVKTMPRTVAAAPAQDGPVFAAYKTNAWWLPEYSRLNAMLDKAGGMLSTSYRSGPQGTSIVFIELRRGPNRGLSAVIDSPRPAIKVLDETTGLLGPEDHRTVFTLRDINLDGIPDQARMEPAGKPMFQETFTDDGFMRVRDSTEHDAFLSMWTIGLGFCTNRFLHQKESALP